MNDIAQNIAKIEAEIAGLCKLLAVSKRQSNEKIMAAYENGFKRFGENYVQELVVKQEALPNDIEWHMIGHLQSNKVKYIAPFVKLIHSVDSLKLLKEINKQAKKNERVIDCLLQIHIAEEDTKNGLTRNGLSDFFTNDIASLKNVRIVGIMGMSTFTKDKKQVAKEFASLKSIFDKVKENNPTLPITELSMGMSGDWPLAVENGSTLIRVGNTIFGTRL